METVRIILILAGLVGLLLAGLKIDFTRVSPGWMGAFAIGVALLLQIIVVQ